MGKIIYLIQKKSKWKDNKFWKKSIAKQIIWLRSDVICNNLNDAIDSQYIVKSEITKAKNS